MKFSLRFSLNTTHALTRQSGGSVLQMLHFSLLEVVRTPTEAALHCSGRGVCVCVIIRTTPAVCIQMASLNAKWIIAGFGHQTGCNLSFKVTLKAAHYFGFPSYLHFGAGQTGHECPTSILPSQEAQGVRHSLAFLFCLSLSVLRPLELSFSPHWA